MFPPPVAMPPERDSQSLPVTRKPGQVTAAVVLLWVEVALFGITACLGLTIVDRIPPEFSALLLFLLLLLIAYPVFLGILAVNLNRRRNWARATIIVMSVLGITGGVSQLVGGEASALIGIGFSFVVLLLVSGQAASDWFTADVGVTSGETSDGGPGSTPQMPTGIAAAATWLWLNVFGVLLIAIMLALFGYLLIEEAGATSEDVSVIVWITANAVIWAIVQAVLNIGIAKHRNWARIASIVSTLIFGTLTTGAWLYFASWSDDPEILISAITSIGWTLIVVALLLSPRSREWCRPTSSKPTKEPDAHFAEI